MGPLLPSQARPLSVLQGVELANQFDGFVDALLIGEAKDAGPSPKGPGHMLVRGFYALGGRKDSGPSPGDGH